MAVNVAPHESQLLSGLNTATNYSSILMDIQTGTVPFASQSLDTFVLYDSVMHIDGRTGKVRKYD